ncbi:MAG: hypothetical protein N3C12_14165 [Candidatus Binatia bacterium]|nr:hypothetical protein [Candidatus Binatia bacterium]
MDRSGARFRNSVGWFSIMACLLVAGCGGGGAGPGASGGGSEPAIADGSRSSDVPWWSELAGQGG